MPFYDVSPPIGPGLAVFPGDRRFERWWTMEMARGASCDVGNFHTTTHIGAHTDAPSHFIESGTPIDAVPLDAYVGPCRLVDVPRRGGPVTMRDIEGALREGPPRVLVRTGSFPDPHKWNDDFAWIGEDAARALSDAGHRLVGIDTPSVDAASSKTLASHKALAAGGVAILEGLALGGVPGGDYELIALPLRLVGLDASPVRAVLRTL